MLIDIIFYCWIETCLGQGGVQPIVEALKSNTTLTSFYLNCLKIHFDLPSLWTCYDLNQRIDDTVGEEGAKNFADILCSNTSLTELSFSGVELGANGAQYLGTALKKNNTLTSLLIPCKFQIKIRYN